MIHYMGSILVVPFHRASERGTPWTSSDRVLPDRNLFLIPRNLFPSYVGKDATEPVWLDSICAILGMFPYMLEH